MSFSSSFHGFNVETDERVPPSTVAVVSGGGGHAADFATGRSRSWVYIDGFRFVIEYFPGDRTA